MKAHYLFAGLLLACVACDSSEKETPNGFKYKVLAKGNGVLPKPGQLLLVDFIFKDSKDSVWSDSYKNGAPAPVRIQDSTLLTSEKGVMQVFRFLSPGDSIVCSLPIKDFYRDMVGGAVPPEVDSTLTMTYTFKAKDIMEIPQYQEMMEKQAEEKAAKQLQEDIAAIDKFLQEKGIVATQLESGLRYVITKAGKGENAKPGQTIKVNYTGYTLEGTYFDSSVKKIAEEKGIYNAGREPYTPYEVTIDQTQVIQGWHEALKTLNKGAQGTFYIPSTLAYGPDRRSPEIGENQILVFDIEMVEIK